MNFITSGPLVTNVVTNLNGSVTVMTSQARAFSISIFWVVGGAVLIGWLIWILTRPRAAEGE